MNVMEKSDYAVVPVNRPNKEEQSSAEVGEQRAWIVGEHSPSYMFPTQSGNQHVPDSRRVCDGLATPSLVFTIRAVCVNALARICAGAVRVTARAKIWHTSEWRAILSAGQQTAPA